MTFIGKSPKQEAGLNQNYKGIDHLALFLSTHLKKKTIKITSMFT